RRPCARGGPARPPRHGRCQSSLPSPTPFAVPCLLLIRANASVNRSVYLLRYTDLFTCGTLRHRLEYVSKETARTDAKPDVRRRILDAAADLFYREGFNAVGVDRISEQAEVSKRTLYKHFGSKDRLAAAALEEFGPAVLALYVPAGSSEQPPREAILGVFD